jgi:hypothetical protein
MIIHFLNELVGDHPGFFDLLGLDGQPHGDLQPDGVPGQGVGAGAVTRVANRGRGNDIRSLSLLFAVARRHKTPYKSYGFFFSGSKIESI